ncbi:cation:proton antiporter [Pseudonocardia charpentierae]|uniref:Cation:proton antiporter n=1 Tax=Pseudonocardia charpentierae TaxID=3075545 RepID=A0ABU2NA08_9PSEU|nr:cation:proton antiporter [Pseudonocardia sp. DSM 45834]MDT0350782.1 cation:proton antiporter [Pseudonocardia sp. DSM 45834]
MHVAETLVALGGAFLVCGLLARAGVRIGLPTIPLFMLAGIVFGPHTPGLALVDDPADLELVARLGLVFLLFYLGLEFSLGQLLAGGLRLLTASGIYLALNVGGGLALGFALGWGVREALVVAGVVGISSSAIVTKLLVDLGRLGNRETRVILGIIVIEDVFLALYLALLQPVLGNSDGALDAVLGIVSAFGFLLALAMVARYGAHIVGKLVDTRDEEIVVVVFVGLAILTAGVAEQLGVSDAIGAFMVGLILGATSRADRLRTMTHPLRNAFAAIFFFTFGLSIEPGDVLGVAPQIAVAVLVTVVLCLVAGGVAARLHRYGRVAAANIGLTVLSRGEFSLILASLALASGLDARLGSFTAGYVLVLAVVGPLAVSMSERLARHVPRRWFPGPPAPPPERDGARRPADELEMDVGAASLERLGADLLHVRVSEGSQLHGVHVAELRLPRQSTLGMVVRRGTATPPAPDTRLVEGDVLVVFAPPEHRLATERRLRAVHRSGRLARWRGDHGF